MRLLPAALSLVSLAIAAPALAHGNEPVLPEAIAALEQGPIYVDYDARPSLTERDADRLGRALDARGHVFVAVLPSSVSEEPSSSPAGVAATLGAKVGREGTYVVSVGGRLGAWSSLVQRSHVDAALAGAHGSLDERLTSIVAALPEATAEDSSNWTAFAIAAAVILALSGVLLLVVRRRRRVSSRP